ncbi:extracellular solute-binding protein [Micromonospora yangpuensis]|uniref:Alpha-glucoside transport system substrate-binding protein n=1 Tax=Micromonospora yangpuensis TaxID=683228 RepID=A0A1C6UT61_9ACTN|nr:extracellular solute-binding protein [Micromonospora yangpuensis]GGM24904.1 sugar ABC transporter substrate-binding protein [Micromonospora yangpuensis]SCL57277.1 alpha-glucoside transport system substrate-binding protein [Micromonospora yangpuensis]
MNRAGRVRRRTLLRAATAASVPTAVGFTGCRGGARPVRVAVVWSADELARFQSVLADYTTATGLPTQVTSAGDDIDAFLNARYLAGTSPDVAILPRPGLVTEYARRGWLAEVTPDVGYRAPRGLTDLLSPDGRRYGVWVKAAHKSLFWHYPSVLASEPPTTWDALVARSRQLGTLARSGTGPAPLAVGAADGWVLTDWFENVLADVTAPREYDALARGEADWAGPPVRDALDRLAEIWSIPGAFPGGGRRALLTQFQESVIEVVHRRSAVLVYGADFAGGVAQRFRRGTEEPATFRFPGAWALAAPLLVGGDVAVAFTGSGPGADLVRWFTRRSSFQRWRSAGGYLSPDVNVPTQDYPDQKTQLLAEQLRTATSPRFDLSDQLPGPFTGSDGVGIWRIMQDFFADVTTGIRADEAIRRATGQLAVAARATGPAR